jgi:hypothetical protein
MTNHNFTLPILDLVLSNIESAVEVGMRSLRLRKPFSVPAVAPICAMRVRTQFRQDKNVALNLLTL